MDNEKDLQKAREERAVELVLFSVDELRRALLVRVEGVRRGGTREELVQMVLDWEAAQGTPMIELTKKVYELVHSREVVALAALERLKFDEYRMRSDHRDWVKQCYEMCREAIFRDLERAGYTRDEAKTAFSELLMSGK